MNILHRDFIEFCQQLITKDPSGPTVSALLEAYLRLSSVTVVPAVAPTRPETSDHSQPHQVYLITNTVTGKAYVGRAAKGFALRYPHGWWVSHNLELAVDSVHFGRAAFRVQVFQCTDPEDMCKFEAALYDYLTANGRVYNKVRPSEDLSTQYLPLPCAESVETISLDLLSTENQ